MAVVILPLVSGQAVGAIVGNRSTSISDYTQIERTNHSNIPNETRHGVPASEFAKLWSRDDDSAPRDAGTGSIFALTSHTDWVFESPPEEVAQWNAGEAGNIPAGDTDRAYHPPSATTTSGTFLRDVGVSIFAISPSTVAHVSEGHTQRYIAPNGTIYYHVDFWTRVPEDVTTPTHREEWQLESASVESVEVRMGSTEISENVNPDGNAIGFTSHPFDGSRQLTIDVTVETELSVTIEDRVTKTVEECGLVNGTYRCEPNQIEVWEFSSERRHESVTVSDSVNVKMNQPRAAVLTAQRDGVTGVNSVAISFQGPWSVMTTSFNQNLSSEWGFYTARDTDWDTLDVESAPYEPADDSMDSPVHPLEVHAFPVNKSEFDSTANIDFQLRNASAMRGDSFKTRIVEVNGDTQSSPSDTIGEDIDVPVVANSYTSSSQVILESPRDVSQSAFEISGIVDGVSSPAIPISSQTLHETDLDVAVLETNASHAKIRVHLEDESGQPIDLRSRNGSIIVGESSAKTGRSGNATVITETVLGRTVTAEYVPQKWWKDRPAYAATSSTAVIGKDRSPREIQGLFLEGLNALSEVTLLFAIISSPVLGLYYAVYRMLGIGVWPPWRHF